MPVEQILKDAQPKMEAAVMESAANDRAAREPLPGAYANAFNKEPLVVQTSLGPVTIRSMVLYDINVFKLIDSPFYRIMTGTNELNADNKTSLFTTEEESYELIFQFTHPIKEVYQLFKKGKEVYRDTVMEKVAFVYNVTDAAMLVEKIMSHVFDVQMAKVNFESSPETDSSSDSGEKKRLTEPTPTSTTS
jgi:hypothetical protein